MKRCVPVAHPHWDRCHEPGRTAVAHALSDASAARLRPAVDGTGAQQRWTVPAPTHVYCGEAAAAWTWPTWRTGQMTVVAAVHAGTTVMQASAVKTVTTVRRSGLDCGGGEPEVTAAAHLLAALHSGQQRVFGGSLGSHGVLCQLRTGPTEIVTMCGWRMESELMSTGAKTTSLLTGIARIKQPNDTLTFQIWNE